MTVIETASSSIPDARTDGLAGAPDLPDIALSRHNVRSHLETGLRLVGRFRANLLTRYGTRYPSQVKSMGADSRRLSELEVSASLTLSQLDFTEQFADTTETALICVGGWHAATQLIRELLSFNALSGGEPDITVDALALLESMSTSHEALAQIEEMVGDIDDQLDRHEVGF